MEATHSTVKCDFPGPTLPSQPHRIKGENNEVSFAKVKERREERREEGLHNIIYFYNFILKKKTPKILYFLEFRTSNTFYTTVNKCKYSLDFIY